MKSSDITIEVGQYLLAQNQVNIEMAPLWSMAIKRYGLNEKLLPKECKQKVGMFLLDGLEVKDWSDIYYAVTAYYIIGNNEKRRDQFIIPKRVVEMDREDQEDFLKVASANRLGELIRNTKIQYRTFMNGIKSSKYAQNLDPYYCDPGNFKYIDEMIEED